MKQKNVQKDKNDHLNEKNTFEAFDKDSLTPWPTGL